MADPAGHDGDLSYHQRMVADAHRMVAYERALRRVVRRGDVVLDVGAGTGVLSLMAARLGARVHAVESMPVGALIEGLARHHGLEQKIVVHQADLRTLPVAEPVDVIVSDCLGRFLLDDRMLEAMNAAFAWLRPGGVVIPAHVELVLAPVELAYLPVLDTWSTPTLGLDLSPLTLFAEHQTYPLACHPGQLLATPQQVASWTPPAAGPTFELALDFTATRTGRLRGLAGWFRARLAAAGQSAAARPAQPRERRPMAARAREASIARVHEASQRRSQAETKPAGAVPTAPRAELPAAATPRRNKSAALPAVELSTEPGVETHWSQLLFPLPPRIVASGERLEVQLLPLADANWRWSVVHHRQDGSHETLARQTGGLQPSSLVAAPLARLDKHAVSALQERAEAAWHAGDIAQALRDFAAITQALEPRDRDAPDAWENLGIAWHTLGQYTQAIVPLLRALDGDLTSREQSLSLLVDAAFRAGNHGDGARWLAIYEAHFGPHPAGWAPSNR